MSLTENENQRLEALKQYEILDAPPEDFFDDLTQFIADICETPIALISLVDSEREWFKSQVGLTLSQIPRSISFGAYTILQSEILIIPDTSQDQQFAQNPLVMSEPHFRFYAGVPLINSSGFALGSLAIIDVVPRSLSLKEQAILQHSARQIVKHIELHRQKIIDNLLFTNNPNPMLVYDEQTLQILYVNQAAIIQYGYSQEEFSQMQITDIRPPEDVPILLKFLEEKNSSLNFLGEWRHRRKNGQIIDVEIITQSAKYAGKNARLVDIRDITERKRVERTLKAQSQQEQLMRTVAQRIRQSLNLQDILNATVQEVRDLLGVDRVVVYQFAPDMSGKIMAESVQPGWTVALGVQVEDTCFQTGAGWDYHQGIKRAIANIYEAGLTDCHVDLLEQFEVKANLVVPILVKVGEENAGSFLWGLLIAHQCSAPRNWEENQLDLLDQLTVQIAIAIQQSSAFEQAKNEIVERKKAEVNLKSALAEKEVLLKEVHHRVKNNLQIVSSLVQLQSQTLKDPELIRVLRESQNRIESISLIHKNLYTSPNIGQLDIVDYIQNLATSILISYQIYPGSVSLETNIDTVNLNVDQAIACGLIINELISNSLKHAFPQQQVGQIVIDLRNLANNVEMIVRDNGIGLPDDLDWKNTDSLGLSLVYDLVTEQLEGNITVECHHGTVFKIQFPRLSFQL